jgi:thiol-disulfide isomerase/thioredoxin
MKRAVELSRQKGAGAASACCLNGIPTRGAESESPPVRGAYGKIAPMRSLRHSIPPKVVLISALILLGVGGLTGLLAPAEAGEWLPRDQRVPVDLSGSLYSLAGDPVELRDFEDDVLLVNFWATWCAPCRVEMPSMANLHDRYRGRGVRIVAITDEEPDAVRRFLDQSPYPFTILIDHGGVMAGRLGIWAIPWTLVLDSRRRLVHFHQGARRWDTPDILQSLDRVLSE